MEKFVWRDQKPSELRTLIRNQFAPYFPYSPPKDNLGSLTRKTLPLARETALDFLADALVQPKLSKKFKYQQFRLVKNTLKMLKEENPEGLKRLVFYCLQDPFGASSFAWNPRFVFDDSQGVPVDLRKMQVLY